jgi:hypothetical protein
MKHFVAIPGQDGTPELHPLKTWIRLHPEELPSSADPAARRTTRQLRRLLVKQGWTMSETENDVRLFRPADGELAPAQQAVGGNDAPDEGNSPAGERAWVAGLVSRLQVALQAMDKALEVRAGYRLAYSREILSYRGADPVREEGMRYETDLLIVERLADGWTPRVVVEAKLRRVTTHDAITYSQKAATHKHVHPYLRYGIFLGGRGRNLLPGRLFRHGAHFDFMLSWKGLEPSVQEFDSFVALLVDEVRASRLLQEIMFNTRSRSRAGYSVLHKPVVAR